MKENNSFMKKKINLQSFVFFLFVQVAIFIFFIFFAKENDLLFSNSFFLTGANDSLGFYNLAVDKYLEMKNVGIAVFEISPQGQLPAGFGALLFYFTNSVNPLVFIGLASFLHLLTTFIYYLLFNLFFSRGISIVGALFLQLTPMSATWFLQHHKESYTCLAFAVIVYIILKRRKVYDVLGMFVAIFIFALAKAYLIPFLMFFVVIFWTYKTVTLGEMSCKIRESLLIIVYIIFMLNMQRGSVNLEEYIKPKNDRVGILSEKEESYFVAKIQKARDWFYSHHDGATTYDRHLRFSTKIDLLKYLPKAIYVGYFSPNLISLLNRQSLSVNHRAKFEQQITEIFVTLVSILILIYCFKFKRIIWVYILASSPLVLVFVYCTPNLGTVVRYRSPYYLILSGFAMCCALEYLKNFIKKKE